MGSGRKYGRAQRDDRCASLAVVLTVPGEEGMEAMSVFSVVSTAR
jgi:hypothetical protein